MKRVLVVLIVLLVAAFLFFIPEHNRTPFFDSEGVIWKGEKFGIAIGQTDAIDRAGLQGRGWTYDHTEVGGGCIRHKYSSDFSLIVFVDESWRHGTLCVISKGQHVRAVEWFYGPFWPEL